MEQHIVKILQTEFITHDVKRFVVEKPKGYHYQAGQATEVAINKEKWKNENRPFTFTSLNDSDTLEFMIKIYPKNNGVTKELEKLQKGEELIIHDVWGAITYHGPGVFIAGGAGITPFISILRQLKKENKIEGNKLIFANKTSDDIILFEELESLLGDNFINVLTRENVMGFKEGHIDKRFLTEYVKDFSQHFYICGPDKFVTDLQKILMDLGAKSDGIIVES